MNRLGTKQVRTNECDHRRISAAVVSHVDDQSVSAVNKVHCRRDCIGAEFFVHEIEKLEVSDVAAQAFNLTEAVIHPGQVALSLFAFFGRRLLAWATLRNCFIRITYAKML